MLILDFNILGYNKSSVQMDNDGTLCGA